MAIIAFVTSLLALMAGRKPGFMEDYHIVAFNTSDLGHNLVNTSATATATSTTAPTATSTSSGIGSFFSSVTGEIQNLTSSITSAIEGEIEGELNDIENDLADELAKVLGIKQWYSLHLMDACEGNYAPNATVKGASYNV